MGNVEGKGSLVLLSSRKKASADGDQSEVGRERGGKGGQGAGHVETYRGWGMGFILSVMGSHRETSSK